MATASSSNAASSEASVSKSAGSISVWISPVYSVRSDIPKRLSAGTSDAGRSTKKS